MLQVRLTINNVTSTWPVGPKPGSRSKKITHVYVRRNMASRYGADVKEVIAELQELSHDLEFPRLEIDHGNEDYLAVEVVGWRPMTPEEIGIWHQQEQQSAAVRAQQEMFESQRALERLKREHPEWLREGL